MTPNEAHSMALDAATSLAKWGVETLITPSLARKDPEVVHRYSGEGRVKPGYWVNVRFTPTTHRESDMIAKVRKALNDSGIHFEHRSIETFADHDDREYWYLDQSLTYIEP